MDTIERDLRAAMADGSDHLELAPQTARAAWSDGRTRVRSKQSRRTSVPRYRLVAGVGLAVVATVVGSAILLGGSNHLTSAHLTHQTALTTGGGAGNTRPSSRRATDQRNGVTTFGPTQLKKSDNLPDGPTNPIAAPGAAPSIAGSGGGLTYGKYAPNDTGLGATRVVKTGRLDISVTKGQVSATITKIGNLATSLGGYVSQSQTTDFRNSPVGVVTVRIPVEKFDSAVTTTAGYGHQKSLVTTANDVTGKYVDLGARLSSLKHTRETYLTILARARTIGETLSVQQRVDDTQSQIERLQGQLKVLRNQSSDGTLTVNVSQPGSPVATTVHHKRSGFSKAWHNSTHRFNRGIYAIVGALGPLLLVLIALGLLFVLIRFGGRRVRRGPAS